MLTAACLVDPETRAEFEAQQRSTNAMLMGGGGGQNLDVASFLAGASSKKGGNGNGNGKKK